MVQYFYSSDSDVSRDTELQEWIHEIFTHGFLENKLSGTKCIVFMQMFDKFVGSLSQY